MLALQCVFPDPARCIDFPSRLEADSASNAFNGCECLVVVLALLAAVSDSQGPIRKVTGLIFPDGNNPVYVLALHPAQVALYARWPTILGD
jgi:hypothetical protein